MDFYFRFKRTDLLLLATVFYAFFALAFEAVAELVFGISVLFLIFLVLKDRHFSIKKPPFYFLAFAILIAMSSWAFMLIQQPEIADSSPRVESLANKFLFIPIALILAGSVPKTFLLWGALGLSALLMPWLAGNGLDDVKDALMGQRTGFGRHPITMGMIYAVALIGALVFSRRIIGSRLLSWRFLLWGFLMLVLLFAVWASQTRAIYLALAVLVVLGLSTLLFFAYQRGGSFVRIFWLFTLSVSLLVVLSVVLFRLGYFDSIARKILDESGVIQSLINGDLAAIPKNSFGLRIHFWVDAWNMGLDRFWVGWGEGGNHYLHEKAGNFFGDRHFVTVHNDLLELFLAYGLPGVLLFVALIFWLTREVFRLFLARQMPLDFLIFYILFMVFYVVNGLFMSVLYFDESLLLWNVILSGYLGFVFKYQSFQNWMMTDVE
ncbi:O-antigen ligase family protein [Oceanospirillum sp.]|uniref:O-antigen ligase family protein n=1 Tax=Oceanospirillum sp. TaxID=2021254 RepID=UPI003A950AC5